jgi:translation initiation factor 1
VYVRLEKKGRGGKTVSVIDGLHLSLQEREKLLKQFKTILGTGGTIKDNALEIQGDHRDRIIELLQTMGYRPKRSGS